MVNPRRKLAIAAQAERMLSEAGVTEAPVPVDKIALKCVSSITLKEAAPEVSGMFARAGREFVIAVNSAHSRNRQRFTIAHELGHYLLHRHHQEVWVDGPLFYRNEQSSDATDDLEIEANHFAACLLMPEAWVRRDVLRLSLDDEAGLSAIAKALAKSYRVSETAMTLRLVNLGLARQ